LAAALGTGLLGIEQGLAPPDRVEGSAYAAPVEDGAVLPTSLAEATTGFLGSKAARELFGDVFVDHYAATRQWEDREYRKHVSDWDLARYFEII
jgi:glutamine synthetase